MSAWPEIEARFARLRHVGSLRRNADNCGLALALEIETLGTQRFETLLVTGREPGAPKLRSGQRPTRLRVTGRA